MVAGEIKSDVVYENDHILAFRDIEPKAPTHILVIPKIHISTINDIKPSNTELVGQLFLGAKKIAEQEGISDVGYRTVINCNEDAGQTVFHLHLHLLGGRRMEWPPG